MSNFKVGDVVIGVGFKDAPERNGDEGVVISGLYFGVGRSRTGDLNPPSWRHNVEWADGTIHRCLPENLRLKRPPSWDKWIYDTSGVEGEHQDGPRVSHYDNRTYFVDKDGRVYVVAGQ